jgi:hypothetical protein
MHRFLVRLSESEASNHRPSLADFTTTTPELKFSVHTASGVPPNTTYGEPARAIPHDANQSLGDCIHGSGVNSLALEHATERIDHLEGYGHLHGNAVHVSYREVAENSSVNGRRPSGAVRIVGRQQNVSRRVRQ